MNKIVIKKRVALSVLMIGRILLWDVANAAMVVTQTDKVQVAVYGRVNRAIRHAHDGDGEEAIYHGDTDNRSTRIGVKVTAEAIDEFIVGAHLEYGSEPNASNTVWQEWSDTDDDVLTNRTLEVFLDCPLGRLSLSQGKSASDDPTDVDLSGTTMVDSAKTHSMASSLHYDAPPCNGFRRAVSSASDHGTDGDDLSLRYKGAIAGVKTAGAVSYANYSGVDSKKTQVAGCLSFLANNGLNLTVASGLREDETSGREDATYYYGKIGYIAQLFDLGSTALAIDYGKFEEMKENDDKGDTIGVLAIQKLKSWNAEVYFGYRHYERDRTGTDLDNIDAFISGLKLKF